VDEFVAEVRHTVIETIGGGEERRGEERSQEKKGRAEEEDRGKL
jgi:hypothetical protein